MNEQNDTIRPVELPAFEPIFIKIGEGEFSATMAAIPDNEECDWGGYIKFDNDEYNWPVSFHGDKVDMYEAWFYGARKSSGTHLLNLLDSWHGEIVAFIQRMKAKK